MRVLVVSDIHGNWEALQAVTRHAGTVDAILCLGDIVDYGPEHKECVNWARANVHTTVRGNHDNAAAHRVSCECSPAMRDLSMLTRQEAWKQLDKSDLDWLRSLPAGLDLQLDGRRMHLVHATPRSPLYEYLPPTPSEWSSSVHEVNADLLLVGHTHLPMALRVGPTVVVNPGSVGQPRDGDPRAAYAIIENGEPSLYRVEYDVEATIARLGRSTLPSTAVARLAHILRGEERVRVRSEVES